MKAAAAEAKKRAAWESAGGDDQDKAMELMASKVGDRGGRSKPGQKVSSRYSPGSDIVQPRGARHTTNAAVQGRGR